MSDPSRPRDTLYYDGACGMCRRSSRVLGRLDWLGRLRFEDMTAVAPDSLPVSYADAMRGIPMRTRDGRTLVGYPALRRALLQTPLGCPPAILMYLPGLSHAGRAVYARIAARRSRAACSIHSPTASGDDGARGNAREPGNRVASRAGSADDRTR